MRHPSACLRCCTRRATSGMVGRCARHRDAGAGQPVGRPRGTPITTTMLAFLLFLLVLLRPAPLVAQGVVDFDRSASLGSRPRGCVIVASVIGGVTGAFVGGAVGAMLERAVYDGNPEAGITGFGVGIVLGAAAGIIIARNACDGSSHDELRQRLAIPAPGGSAGPIGMVGAPRLTDHSSGRILAARVTPRTAERPANYNPPSPTPHMRVRTLAPTLLVLSALVPGGAPASAQEVTMRTYAVDGETVLVRELVVPAPLDETWAAFTTGEGLMSWAGPFSDVDLRLGGTMYGVGYRDTPAHQAVLGMFRGASAWTLHMLQRRFSEGPIDWAEALGEG